MSRKESTLGKQGKQVPVKFNTGPRKNYTDLNYTCIHQKLNGHNIELESTFFSELMIEKSDLKSNEGGWNRA